MKAIIGIATIISVASFVLGCSVAGHSVAYADDFTHAAERYQRESWPKTVDEAVLKYSLPITIDFVKGSDDGLDDLNRALSDCVWREKILAIVRNPAVRRYVRLGDPKKDMKEKHLILGHDGRILSVGELWHGA